MEKIFYTNARGAGKTKWLVDQYVKERCAGNYCIYLGNERKRYRFIEEVSSRGFSYSNGLPENNDGYPMLYFLLTIWRTKLEQKTYAMIDIAS